MSPGQYRSSPSKTSPNGVGWEGILDQADGDDRVAAVVVFGHASLEVEEAYDLDLDLDLEA